MALQFTCIRWRDEVILIGGFQDLEVLEELDELLEDVESTSEFEEIEVSVDYLVYNIETENADEDKKWIDATQEQLEIIMDVLEDLLEDGTVGIFDSKTMTIRGVSTDIAITE